MKRRSRVSTRKEESDCKKEVQRSQYFLCLSQEASRDDVISCLRASLEGQGLSCEVAEIRRSERCLLVTSNLNVLVMQAESQGWTREIKGSEEVAIVTCANMDQFKYAEEEYLFTAAEEVFLLLRTIQATPYDEVKLKREGYTVPHGKDFITALTASKPPLLRETYPLHCPQEKEKLVRMLKNSLLFTRGLQLSKIRNYFGEEVAFYFSWMNFYSSFIIIPAIVGVAMRLQSGKEVTVDNDPYLPLFSVLMAIWGVLFLMCWQRRRAVNSFEWNTYNHHLSDHIRPGYHGDLVIDPVTRKQTVYYKSWKRRMWYVFSLLSMLPLLGVGLGVMTLSLNLNGYVKNTESPIYVASLAGFAQPGGVFSSDSPYFLWLVPTIGHSITIYVINQLYGRVASVCTDLENHRTEQSWDSSLIVKRVFFECLDCFMPLFYIAFYQLDVVTLRAELASLFMSDEIRRVLMESVVPFLQELVSSKVARSKCTGQRVIPDVVLAEYDQFDDYLEMVVQFGYITLFASALPLGAAVTLVFLFVESRSDLFKLLYAYRRPVPRRSRDIGVWYDVMSCMVFLAIFTNCVILGFSSEQLMQWVPSLFERDSQDGDQIMAVGSGRYVVGIVFGFEHLLVVVAIWLRWVIKPQPKWVRQAIARRKYLANEKLLYPISANISQTGHKD